MVSDGVILSFYTILVSIVTIPIMVAVLLRLKGKVKVWPFFLGLLIYFGFGILCPTFIHTIFLNEGRPTHAFLNGNAFVYCTYFAIVTGLLEEVGILVAFKKILVKYDDRRSSIMYALGHAGLDSFLIAGPMLFVYITCGTAINELGVDAFRDQWSDMQKVDIEKVIETLTGMGLMDALAIGFERLMFFVMHIFLSIMIFYAVKRENMAFFWIAAVIRGLCTVPGSLRNFGAFNVEGSTYILLGYAIVIIALAGFMAIKLYRSYNKETVLSPADLFRPAPKL